MKRFTLIFTVLLIFAKTVAQISVDGDALVFNKKYSGIDYLIVFNKIDNNSAIKFNGTYSTLNWYKYDDLSNPLTNQSDNFNVEDATGYILEVDGERKASIWVLDYSNYLPVMNALSIAPAQDNECEGLQLVLDANVPNLSYKTPAGILYKIDREFILKYKTKEWTTEWIDNEVEKKITLSSNDLFVAELPLCDTRFSIEGDQFALGLSLSPFRLESDLYFAKRVEAHITSAATTRDQLNEDQRPSAATTLEGSAPMDILFLSNANMPVAEFYQWEIYKDNQLLFVRNDRDQRYTFNESGEYLVKLVTSNASCVYADSVRLKMSDSDLQVPSVFTPNGDQLNDEFRVAYRSLISFNGWIYNRWGRRVFRWNDPQKGWDGRINGREAAMGGYIYLIEAVGSDGKKYKMKGVVNLLR
ncbi:MAG: gliding motility-associated C-terminal domain-containing protein [Paludibacteraceae bacterium]|nr:gliding motility-associated C-terminal domain-containing protein [Paludibacteraceae bacterium]